MVVVIHRAKTYPAISSRTFLVRLAWHSRWMLEPTLELSTYEQVLTHALPSSVFCEDLSSRHGIDVEMALKMDIPA